MFRLTRSQVQPIGIDIGLDSIKLLQVETIGQTLSVVASHRQSLPAEARQRPELRLPLACDLVRQSLRLGGFRGRRAVVALPRELLNVKNLRLPLIPAAELASAIRFEARNIFPFDTDAAHVQILPAGEVRQGLDVRQETIVLAAKHEEVDNFVEQIHRSGVTLEAIDAEPCAAYRAFERFLRRREDEQDVNVIVDVGCRRSQVVIGRGRDISFLKTVDIGSDQFQAAVSQRLGITIEEARALRRRLIEAAPAEASAPQTAEASARKDPVRQAVFDATRSTMEEMGREIALCLRYYSVTFRGQRPSKVKLIGGESGDALLVGVLNAVLGVPVEPGRPLFSVDTSRMKPADRRGTMGEWATALGLGLKLTRDYYAPRDGKPRAPGAPWAEPAKPVAEVVDIEQVAGNGNSNGSREPRREEIHA